MITTRWTKGDMLEKLDENMIFIYSSKSKETLNKQLQIISKKETNINPRIENYNY